MEGPLRTLRRCPLLWVLRLMAATTTTPDAPTVADARRARTDDKAAAVVAAIVDAIETGTADPAGWRAPWHTSPSFLAPSNPTTGRPYTGGNRFLLAMVAAERGYDRNLWATFKQWQAADAQVRKGERGSIILRPRMVKTTDAAGLESTKVVGFGAHYVFAVAQVDGYPLEPLPEPPAGPDDWHADTDLWMRAVALEVDTRHTNEGRAYYNRLRDEVTLPEPSSFLTALDYYSTRAHEYGHATGHASRLDRTFGTRFGDDAYAAEELCAELAAAITMANLGLASTPRADHAQYLASWLRVLKAEPSSLFHVAGRAEKAAAWLADTAGRRLEDARRLAALASRVDALEPDTLEPAAVLELV